MKPRIEFFPWRGVLGTLFCDGSTGIFACLSRREKPLQGVIKKVFPLFYLNSVLLPDFVSQQEHGDAGSDATEIRMKVIVQLLINIVSSNLISEF